MFRFRDVYDARWQSSSGTSDEDIIALRRPKTQVQFFYKQYNQFIAGKLRQLLGDCQHKQLLELGCGRGTSSIYQALTLKINVLASDYSAAALQIAQRNMRKYGIQPRTLQADLYDVPLPDESFDAIISLGVMEHIDEPERAYREMWRLLRPGGVMISMNVPERSDNIQRLAVPVNRCLARIKSFFGGRELKPWLDSQTRSKTKDVYRSTWVGTQFQSIVGRAGYDQVEVYQSNPFPTFDPVTPLLDRIIVRAYGAVLALRRILLRRPQPFLSNERNSRCHFIVARKPHRSCAKLSA